MILPGKGSIMFTYFDCMLGPWIEESVDLPVKWNIWSPLTNTLCLSVCLCLSFCTPVPQFISSLGQYHSNFIKLIEKVTGCNNLLLFQGHLSILSSHRLKNMKQVKWACWCVLTTSRTVDFSNWCLLCGSVPIWLVFGSKEVLQLCQSIPR